MQGRSELRPVSLCYAPSLGRGSTVRQAVRLPRSDLDIGYMRQLSLISPTSRYYPLRNTTKTRHQPTAFSSPFSFFDHLPLEVREKIYEQLIVDLAVVVNGSLETPVRCLRQRTSLAATTGPMLYLSMAYRSVVHPRANFMCTSKQFFSEVRNVIYRSMAVKYERRWDLINAFINGSLHPGAMDLASDASSPVLFPRNANVFSHIRELQLDLFRSSDFNDRIYGAEAQRVTTQMLRILEQNMPQLRILYFKVDDRSRVSTCVMVFLPDSWFLEGVLAIRQVKAIRFIAGPAWSSRKFAQNKRNSRHSISAINAVLEEHCSTNVPEQKLDYGGVRGKQLQIRLAQRMLVWLAPHLHFRDTSNALAIKIVMLQSVL